MNQFYRNLAIWMLIALAMVFLFNTFNSKKVEFEEVSFSAFTRNVEEGKVKEVTIKGQEITGKYVENAGKEKKAFHTYAPDDPDLVKNLRGNAALFKHMNAEPAEGHAPLRAARDGKDACSPRPSPPRAKPIS